MDNYEYNTRIEQEYNRLKEQHPDWSEDQLYTEAQSIVSNLEFNLDNDSDERVIGVEVYCHDCEHETRYNNADQAEYEEYGITHRCAHCGGEDVSRSRFITCHCGTTVYLDGDTQCEGCGQWFNGFGQELKDPSEWEEEDDDD